MLISANAGYDVGFSIHLCKEIGNQKILELSQYSKITAKTLHMTVINL